MNHFIVFADARTGTHYFESILNQHPDIQCFNEIFSHIQPHHFFHFLLEEIKTDPAKIIPFQWHQVFGRYLDFVYAHFGDGPHVVGMDIKYYQMDWVPGLMDVLKKKKVKAVHLIRKNYLKHNIACYLHSIREQLGRQFHETQKVKPVKVDVNLQTLIDDLQRRQKTIDHYGQYIKKYLPCLDVYYEDCFDNPEMISQVMAPSVLDRIYDYLGIERRLYDMKTDYIKSNPGTLRDLVNNYDAVVDCLVGTPWRWVLDDTIGENMPDVKAMNAHGEALANSGRVDEAKEIFFKCTRLKPDFAEAYNNLGVMFYGQGNINEALGYIKTALRIDPENKQFNANNHAVTSALSGCTAGARMLIFAMICDAWGEEEDRWLRFFLDTYHVSDKVELVICLPVNEGKNKALVEQQFVLPVLGKYIHHSPVKIVEYANIDGMSFDYVLRNQTCTVYQKNLPPGQKIIEKPDLRVFDALYSEFQHSFNPYEYSFLVDMYDMEKSCRQIEEKETGLFPKQFGSTGGERFVTLMKTIDSVCKPDSRLLEVGCGAGAFYHTLKINSKAFDYTGMDLSRKQILRCMTNYPEGDFRVGNVCSLSFPDGHFDFVFENNVLIFTIDPVQAVREMCRVSRGYIYFTIQTLEKPTGLYCYYPFTHKLKMNPETKAVQVPDDQRRFFSKEIWYSHVDDSCMEAMVVKAPIYIPSNRELESYIGGEMLNGRLVMVHHEVSQEKKMFWVNEAVSSASILHDDCAVMENDRKMELDVMIQTYLVKVN